MPIIMPKSGKPKKKTDTKAPAKPRHGIFQKTVPIEEPTEKKKKKSPAKTASAGALGPFEYPEHWEAYAAELNPVELEKAEDDIRTRHEAGYRVTMVQKQDGGWRPEWRAGYTKAQQKGRKDTIRSVGAFKLPSLYDVVHDERNMQAMIAVFGQPQVHEKSLGNYVRNALNDSGIKTALMRDEYWNGVESKVDFDVPFEERAYRTIDAITDVLAGRGSLEWQGSTVMEAVLNYAADTGMLTDATKQLSPAFQGFFDSLGINEKIPTSDNELRDWILKHISPAAGQGGKKQNRANLQMVAKQLYEGLLEVFDGVLDDFFEEVQDMITTNFYKPIPMQEVDDTMKRLWSIAHVMNYQLNKVTKLVAAATKLNDPWSTPVYSKKARTIRDQVAVMMDAFNSLPKTVVTKWARHDVSAKGMSYEEKYAQTMRAFQQSFDELTEVFRQLDMWEGTRASNSKILFKALAIQREWFKDKGFLELWLKDNGMDVEKAVSTQDVIDIINDLLADA